LEFGNHVFGLTDEHFKNELNKKKWAANSIAPTNEIKTTSHFWITHRLKLHIFLSIHQLAQPCPAPPKCWHQEIDSSSCITFSSLNGGDISCITRNDGSDMDANVVGSDPIGNPMKFRPRVLPFLMVKSTFLMVNLHPIIIFQGKLTHFHFCPLLNQHFPDFFDG
jgi:hypothetical protein